MPTFTTNQWAILLLVLILGWLLGLMSRSGGRKWKKAYESERSDGIRYRSDADAKLATANTRIAELEAELKTERDRATQVATARGATDDLGLIRGIGRGGATQLNGMGIHRYEDITTMTAANEAALETRMGAEPGYIARERWREQAEMLAANRLDDHRRLFA